LFLGHMQGMLYCTSQNSGLLKTRATASHITHTGEW
jgi:hypothetical protein